MVCRSIYIESKEEKDRQEDGWRLGCRYHPSPAGSVGGGATCATIRREGRGRGNTSAEAQRSRLCITHIKSKSSLPIIH